MTVCQARAELKRRLVFGDPLQVEAVDLLSLLEEIKAAGVDPKKMPCPACHGASEVRCHECGRYDYCHECHGKGTAGEANFELLDKEALTKILAGIRERAAVNEGEVVNAFA